MCASTSRHLERRRLRSRRRRTRAAEVGMNISETYIRRPIATSLEQQFISIPELSELTSWSGVGVTSITLQFNLNRNIDAAAGDVQQAINAASGLLPKDLP